MILMTKKSVYVREVIDIIFDMRVAIEIYINFFLFWVNDNLVLGVL